MNKSGAIQCTSNYLCLLFIEVPITIWTLFDIDLLDGDYTVWNIYVVCWKAKVVLKHSPSSTLMHFKTWVLLVLLGKMNVYIKKIPLVIIIICIATPLEYNNSTTLSSSLIITNLLSSDIIPSHTNGNGSSFTLFQWEIILI